MTDNTLHITVSLNDSILDPEAQAIFDAARRLEIGNDRIAEIKQKKVFSLSFHADTNEKEKERIAQELCEKLLANSVTEKFTISKD